MDDQTLRVYNEQAAEIAARHRAAGTGDELHRVILRYFHPNGATGDIGCGSGRDLEWLLHAGFPTVGYDASEGMLDQARQYCREGDFRSAALPSLKEIPDESFQNLLCRAVLMHLPETDGPGAIQAFARVLRPHGRLILTYRTSAAPGEREPDGRLFSPLTRASLTGWLECSGFEVLHFSHRLDGPPRNVTWFAFAAGKK